MPNPICPTMRAPDPREITETSVVGLPPVGTACAFSGSLCGLKLVPLKRRSFVPGEHRAGAQSHPPALIRVLRNTPKGHNASRQAVIMRHHADY